MKKFKEYMSEETNPFALTDKGLVNIDDPGVKENLNALIDGATRKSFVTPYIGLEAIRKVLANYHINIPRYTFSEGEHGFTAFEINQFGEKMGMNNDGEVVVKNDSPYYLFFEYEINDNGMFEIYSEIVNEDELDELMSDIEDEMEEDDEEEVSKELDEEKSEEEKPKWTGKYAPRSKGGSLLRSIGKDYLKFLKTRKKPSRKLPFKREK